MDNSEQIDNRPLSPVGSPLLPESNLGKDEGGVHKNMTRAEYVTALIATRKGRTPVTTICPSCNESMTSKTPTLENKWMCTFVLGNVLSIVFVLGALLTLVGLVGIRQTMVWVFKQNELVANIVTGILGVLILIAGIICCAKCCESRNKPIDIPHYCPLCKAYLGVNTANEELNRRKKRRDLSELDA